jgi:hypothetical protein
MTQQIEITHETQRTIQGLASCSNLLERLTVFLARLSRHPDQDAGEQVRHAFEELQRKLRTVQRTVRASLAAATAPQPAAAEPAAGTKWPRTGPSDIPGHCVMCGVSPAVPIPTLLAFLSSNHKTGTLLVRTKDESFTLEIVDGDVVHAVSDHPPEEQRLGHILVQRGAIDQETLESFLERYAATRIWVGEALEREALVDEEEMREALRQQVQQLFHRLFAAEAATFYFYRGEAALPDLRIRMKMIQLLLESARTFDEDCNNNQLFELAPGGAEPEPAPADAAADAAEPERDADAGVPADDAAIDAAMVEQLAHAEDAAPLPDTTTEPPQTA